VNLLDLAKFVFGDPQTKYLVALVVADLALAVVFAFLKGDFRLAQVSDWLDKLVRVGVCYAAAALIASANADLAPLRDAAFYCLVGALLADVLNHFKEAGLPIPDAVAAKDRGAPGPTFGFGSSNVVVDLTKRPGA